MNNFVKQCLNKNIKKYNKKIQIKHPACCFLAVFETYNNTGFGIVFWENISGLKWQCQWAACP